MTQGNQTKATSEQERVSNGWGILQDGDDDEELGLLVSPLAMRYLEQLVEIGLWGGSPEEVARTLLARGLQDLIRDEFLLVHRG